MPAPGKVRALNRRLSKRMKLCLSVVLVALVATLLPSTEYVTGTTICPQENCLDPEKCDDSIVGGTCPQSSDTCCSVVKSDYRTHCRHFGGECLDTCAQSLQQNVVDCPSDQVCCTLVA
ncbi:PREDICTED: uncharacterized protein LOC107186492 [Dufourea novaeangliae]|uniref:uncharacterized protein LOC107186492 n=1 Tax=Dufourea novaeangliae TaxID=178035 RepID=UPI0007679AD0|nr:PREDICTED: uncharacterized protein LOC107186492 [Dufourea novaeangliae]